MSEAGLEEVEIYVYHLPNMVTQYITICPIMDLCLEAERRPGGKYPRGSVKRGVWTWWGHRQQWQGKRRWRKRMMDRIPGEGRDTNVGGTNISN